MDINLTFLENKIQKKRADINFTHLEKENTSKRGGDIGSNISKIKPKRLHAS